MFDAVVRPGGAFKGSAGFFLVKLIVGAINIDRIFIKGNVPRLKNNDQTFPVGFVPVVNILSQLAGYRSLGGRGLSSLWGMDASL